MFILRCTLCVFLRVYVLSISASESSAAIISGIVVGGVVVVLVILVGIVFMAYKIHNLDSRYEYNTTQTSVMVIALVPD